MTVMHDMGEHPVIRNISEFDAKSGSFLERLLFNNRLVLMIFCAVLTALLGWQATRLELGASFERIIPTNHPYIANYLAHKSDLAGLGNVVRISVENTDGTIFDADYLETVRKLNDDLFLLPGVERPYMKSIWTPSTRWMGVTEDGFEGGPVIDEGYDGSPASMARLRTNIERSGEIGALVAADFRSSIILLPLLERDTTSGERLDYHAFSEKLEALRAKYESDTTRIYITGFAKIVGDLISGLYEVISFFALAVVICTIVLYGYTRCWRSTALVVSCSLIAVVWLLGALTTLGYELDPYSVLVPFLVFAIGISHGAQKMNGIMQDIGRGTHKWIAARYTFRRLILAGFTALMADGVGFAVLMVIDIPAIQDLAITASLGMAALIFTNLLLLPILLSFTGVSPRAAKRSLRAELMDLSDPEHKKHPLWAFLDHFTRRKWALRAICVGFAVGLAAFYVSFSLQIGDLDAGAAELRQDSRYNRDSAFMNANYSASSDIFVAMVKTAPGECSAYSTLQKVDVLEWELQQLEGVSATNSLAAFSRRATVGMNEGSFSWFDVPRSQGMINAVLMRTPRELYSQACDMLTVYIYLEDHKAETLQQVVAKIEDFALRNDTETVKFIQAAGNSGIEAATNIVVRKANGQMLLLVYAAVAVLAFVTFGSWRAVVCAILPLLLTSMLCEALMVALGIGVKVATLPVIALGVGIGIDYALYVLTVTMARLRQGMSLSEAYYHALLFTGKVVVLTGVTLGLAVATWGFSPIKFQADMGILLAFMFVVNMVGALILLPALARFLLPATALAKKSSKLSPAS